MRHWTLSAQKDDFHIYLGRFSGFRFSLIRHPFSLVLFCRLMIERRPKPAPPPVYIEPHRVRVASANVRSKRRR